MYSSIGSFAVSQPIGKFVLTSSVFRHDVARLGQKCNKSENTMARSVSARKWKMRSAQIWFDGVAPASTRLNGSQKKKNIKIETELQPPILGKCQRSNDTFWPVLI